MNLKLSALRYNFAKNIISLKSYENKFETFIFELLKLLKVRSLFCEANLA